MKLDQTVELIIKPERIRNIALNARNSSFSTAEAHAFMTLHKEQIEEVMLNALKKFVVEKL